MKPLQTPELIAGVFMLCCLAVAYGFALLVAVGLAVGMLS